MQLEDCNFIVCLDSTRFNQIQPDTSSNLFFLLQHEESPVDSAYGSDPKQEFEVLGSNLVSSFGKMSTEEIRSPSSCSDLSSVSTIKRADSVNYDSVIR